MFLFILKTLILITNKFNLLNSLKTHFYFLQLFQMQISARNSNIPKAQNLCFSSSKTHQLKVASVQFGLLSADEVQRLSVAQICSEVPYDENGNPHFSGVNYVCWVH